MGLNHQDTKSTKEARSKPRDVLRSVFVLLVIFVVRFSLFASIRVIRGLYNSAEAARMTAPPVVFRLAT